MSDTLRTTIELPAPLLRLAKAYAVEHHMILKEVVAEALRKYLAVSTLKKENQAKHS